MRRNPPIIVIIIAFVLLVVFNIFQDFIPRINEPITNIILLTAAIIFGLVYLFKMRNE